MALDLVAYHEDVELEELRARAHAIEAEDRCARVANLWRDKLPTAAGAWRRLARHERERADSLLESARSHHCRALELAGLKDEGDGHFRFGSYSLHLEYPPVPVYRVWVYSHDAYDGPGDPRCGWERTLSEAIESIRELEESC